MTDLFLSYSRRDRDFVQRLHHALDEQGRDIWVDWEDIPLTADWLQEIYDGIAAADAFVFVISPDSAQSEVCGWEVKYAIEHGKRLVPIVYREVEDPEDRAKLHPDINAHNWLFFREEDDFNTTLSLLNEALDTDLDHVRAHTKLMVRAREWREKDESKGFLLVGDELTEAESWLSHAANKQPEPTELHYAYIYASRKAATRRQQQWIVASLAAAVLSMALAVAAGIGFTDANAQRQIADDQREIAERNADVSDRLALAANAQTAFIAGDTDLAVALALESVDLTDAPLAAQRVLEEAAYAPGLRQVIEAHDGGAFSVDVSADGTRVVTGSEDDTVAVWNLADGSLLLRFEDHENDLLDAIFTPDGTEVISGDRDGVVLRWNAATGDLTWRYDATGSTVRAMALTPDGATLLVGTHDGTLLFIDAADGSEANRIEGAHTARIRDAAISPDGAFAATTSDDQTLAIWDLSDGSEVQRITAEKKLTGVTFSADGTHVLTGAGDFNVYVWELATGEREASLGGHVAWINDVVLAPGGMFALSSANDTTLRLWNLHTGLSVLRLTGHTSGIWDVAFTPDGQHAVSVSWDGTLRVWDVAHGMETARYEGHNNDVSATGISADGRRAFTASWDGSVIVWDTTTHAVVNVWQGEGGAIGHAAFSPDGRLILVSDYQGALFLLDGVTGHELVALESVHSSWMHMLTFSLDGTLALAASNDGTVSLWDIAGRELLLHVEDLGADVSHVASAAFNADGTRAVFVLDTGRIVLWDVGTRSEISHIDVTGKLPEAALFLPGDTQLVVTIDTQIVVMDATTGAILRRFNGHTDPVEKRMALSADGQTLVSAAPDGTVRLWDVASGTEIHRIDIGVQVRSLAINGDLTLALIGNNDETARLLNIVPPSLDATILWTLDNRFVPAFTCQERFQYRLALDNTCRAELGLDEGA